MNDEITPLQRFRRTYRDNRTALATQAAANRSAPRSHHLDPRIARRTARTSRTPGIAARLPAEKQDDVRSEGAFALSFGRCVGSRLPRCQPHIQGLNEARDQVQGDTVHFLNGFFRQIRLALADIVQCKDHVDRRCGFSLTAIDNPFPCVGGSRIARSKPLIQGSHNGSSLSSSTS